jgi:hypothetical protein
MVDDGVTVPHGRDYSLRTARQGAPALQLSDPIPQVALKLCKDIYVYVSFDHARPGQKLCRSGGWVGRYYLLGAWCPQGTSKFPHQSFVQCSFLPCLWPDSPQGSTERVYGVWRAHLHACLVSSLPWQASAVDTQLAGGTRVPCGGGGVQPSGGGGCCRGRSLRGGGGGGGGPAAGPVSTKA